MLWGAKDCQLGPLAGDERIVKFLQLARELSDKPTPQYVGSDDAPEHRQGIARHGGDRLGHRIEVLCRDERLVVVHGVASPLRWRGACCRQFWLQIDHRVIIRIGLVIRSQFIVELVEVFDPLCP